MSDYIDTIGRWGRGNIDLNNRIVVHNPDGSISTERSFSTEIDGYEVLLPTVINGEIWNEEDAIEYYYETGDYLGKFDTPEEADEYAEALHERQEWFYGEIGGMIIVRHYNYELGITIGSGNIPNIPDPSKWTYQVGDLDTGGYRDANGTLHRAYVATKVNYEFTWESIEWEMLQHILGLINEPEFMMTAPDPRTFNTMYTGKYYVGDRTGEAKYYTTTRDERANFSLKLKFIEY